MEANYGAGWSCFYDDWGKQSDSQVILDLDIKPHTPGQVAWDIERTLKAVTRDRLNNDDADSVGYLQTAYLLYFKPKNPKLFEYEGNLHAISEESQPRQAETPSGDDLD